MNPASRPLVKSLMKVLSFLMGRRRKVVPKAMRKKVLMLVLQLLDLSNPTEVAIATYMTKNLVHGRRAADEFLLDWADVEFVEVDGRGTMPCLREMTACEMRDSADEEREASVSEAGGAAAASGSDAAPESAPDAATAELAAAAAVPTGAMPVTEPLTMLDLPVAKVVSGTRARKLRREDASASAQKVELRLKGAKIHRGVTKKDRVQRGDVKPLHCCSGCTGRIELLADGTLNLEKACPVHMMLYSKEQQARRMRVHVDKLRGPVFADYELPFDVPNGAILVALDEDDAAQLRPVVKQGVMVVTRAEEQAGVAYVDPGPRRAEAEGAEVDEAASVEDEDVFEVEMVADVRKKGKRREYLIKWKGYETSENTWEPGKNVSDALIAQYHSGLNAAANKSSAAPGDDASGASGQISDAADSEAVASQRSGAPSGTWFHVHGYAVRAWGEAPKVTHRMRMLLTKTKKRAFDAGICVEVIGDPSRYSSKSMRMGMATEHRGKVPFDYTMDEGDWSTRTVAKGYQEEEAPFAENQINGTDVVLGGATVDDALAERIIERTKAAEVAELRERAAAAEAEAATLRAILGIRTAAGEGSMETRVASALRMLHSGKEATAALHGPAVETGRAVQPQAESVAAPTQTERVAQPAAAVSIPTDVVTASVPMSAAEAAERQAAEAAETPVVPTAEAVSTAPLPTAPTVAVEKPVSRPCCGNAPPESARIRWVQHSSQIAECCTVGWQTVDELQQLLCDRHVHTQHKALKSFIGRNPLLRARASKERANVNVPCMNMICYVFAVGAREVRRASLEKI